MKIKKHNRSLKQIAMFIILFLVLTFSAKAQEESLSKNLALGFQLGQYQKDFSLGVNITSPYFIYDKLAFRAKGNYIWNEHPDLNGDITWSSYSNLSVGVVVVAGEIGDYLRLYGEGGALFIFPSTEFSTRNINVGGFGLFGFEFFMDPHANYYIEIGGVGTGAIADKIPGNPIYSNGLLINVGFRFQF